MDINGVEERMEAPKEAYQSTTNRLGVSLIDEASGKAALPGEKDTWCVCLVVKAL